MRYFISIIMLTVCLLAALGCNKMTTNIDREAEIAAVKKAIETSITWCIPEKDRDKMIAHVAKDSSFFMFQMTSTSTIVGYDAFIKFADEVFFDPRFKATSSEIKDLRVSLSPEGSVAWFACLLDDYGEWDGKPIGWTNARWTGVLEKRDGAWLLVQQHFSLPTDREE